jgi:hypothetical protein
MKGNTSLKLALLKLGEFLIMVLIRNIQILSMKLCLHLERVGSISADKNKETKRVEIS